MMNVAQILFTALSLTLPGCPTEDSVNCVWHADLAGNGHGDSFASMSMGNSVLFVFADGRIEIKPAD